MSNRSAAVRTEKRPRSFRRMARFRFARGNGRVKVNGGHIAHNVLKGVRARVQPGR